ncbi:MAG TPA: hypothetical protein VGL35_03485 [Rhizomicrobium sp.]|jgi:hypothetical protein
MNDSTEPRLGADFAARVLNEADRIGARRRRQRGWAGLAGIAGVALGLFVWANLLAGRPEGQQTANTQRFEEMTREVSNGRADEPEALDYMFPDAGPVARFAEQYSDANDGGADMDLLGDEDAGTP